jgi:tetratricopeptide (TPR) repeat protein
VGDDVGDATGQLSAVVGPDLLRIAEEAEGRSLYRHAVRLYQRAAEAGDSDALLRAAELLEGAGRIDEAIGLDQRAAEAGNPLALLQTAWLLEDAGRLDEAARLRQYGLNGARLVGQLRRLSDHAAAVVVASW